MISEEKEIIVQNWVREFLVKNVATLGSDLDTQLKLRARVGLKISLDRPPTYPPTHHPPPTLQAPGFILRNCAESPP